eukprot:2963384-Pleurochrysis_carterae.AAC.1
MSVSLRLKFVAHSSPSPFASGPRPRDEKVPGGARAAGAFAATVSCSRRTGDRRTGDRSATVPPSSLGRDFASVFATLLADEG